MNDKYFIDTNIFIYAIDHRDLRKQNIAKVILRNAQVQKNAAISFQVVQESLNVLTKQGKEYSFDEKQAFLANVLLPLMEVLPSREFYVKSLSIQNRWKFSFYDSMIICASIESGANILYSEDLNHGQKVESIKIVNPFIT